MTPSLTEMMRVFGRIGLLSFGGPAAQISLMHDEIVTRKGWLTDKQLLGALSFCMLLPGPEAMQLATYAGWRLRGVPGGLLAGLLFVLPGALVILVLALGYVAFGQLPLVQALFMGIKAAVIAIVLRALIALSRKALSGLDDWVMAALGFVAMFFLGVPFPILIAAAAVWGFATASAQVGRTDDRASLPSPRTTLRTLAIWGTLWAAPIALVMAAEATFLRDVALLFSTLAIVTFGGAYAVLGYMTQAVVETQGWLSTAQMIDALGLAETTPGPLILVTAFVAFLAGFQNGGLIMALLAWALGLWVTFIPCFLWIFTGAPYLEALLGQPRLKGALAAISAMVVGVILNLSIWFALHVLFDSVIDTGFGPRPEPDSVNWRSIVLVSTAIALLFGLRWPVPYVLAAMAALAGGLHLVSAF